MLNTKVGDILELHSENSYWLFEIVSVKLDSWLVYHHINTSMTSCVGTTGILTIQEYDNYNGRILHQDPLPKT